MKTILLISPYLKEPHRWMVSSYKLAELWQRLGDHVIVVCMGSSTKVEKVSDTLTVHYKKDIFIPDPFNFGISFGFSRYVKKIIKQESPDHIIINKVLFWTSWSIIPLRLAGYKVIVLTDALVGMTWWPRGFIAKIVMGVGGWTMGWITLLLAERVVFFHPQSPKLLSFLRISKKAIVIPTGIDETLYSSNKKDNEKIIITYVGRLESVKGVDDFLSAAVPLKADFPIIEIQVVGWYKDNHPLVTKYQRSVKFTGLRDDIPDILSKTDIFVLPSYSEGLSNALMEAMSSSSACIASDVGGNSFLLQNGVSGLLFSAGDIEALKSHIRRLIDDPSKRISLGQLARQRIEKEFSWNVIGKKYKSLLET